jgi:hypothetical protein
MGDAPSRPAVRTTVWAIGTTPAVSAAVGGDDRPASSWRVRWSADLRNQADAREAHAAGRLDSLAVVRRVEKRILEEPPLGVGKAPEDVVRDEVVLLALDLIEEAVVAEISLLEPGPLRLRQAAEEVVADALGTRNREAQSGPPPSGVRAASRRALSRSIRFLSSRLAR